MSGGVLDERLQRWKSTPSGRSKVIALPASAFFSARAWAADGGDAVEAFGQPMVLAIIDLPLSRDESLHLGRAADGRFARAG